MLLDYPRPFTSSKEDTASREGKRNRPVPKSLWSISISGKASQMRGHHKGQKRGEKYNEGGPQRRNVSVSAKGGKAGENDNDRGKGIEVDLREGGALRTRQCLTEGPGKEKRRGGKGRKSPLERRFRKTWSGETDPGQKKKEKTRPPGPMKRNAPAPEAARLGRAGPPQ